MLAWLSRIYEVEGWMADKPRRQSIEMLASWPLMSLAIRPLLELASCLPVDLGQLFRLESDALPELPTHAQQLRVLYAGADRSERTAEAMDYFACHTLTDLAAWARRAAPVVAASKLPAHARQLIATRLGGLATLDEFEKQFPFRQSGGYSARMPDVGYVARHPDSDRYEESPSTVAPLFTSALALRLRFAGWGQVLLATDPDPPTDEVGCTGTHMLHAADGDRRFDRALVWQATDPAHDLTRGPAAALPRIGVNCVEVSLVAAAEASAGFLPLQVVQAQGAVQASGVQQAMTVDGFTSLCDLTPADIVGPDRTIRFDLLPRQGVHPFLNGQNHLVFQDGEPIDPFVLAVSVETEHGPRLAFQREVYNRGVSMLDMTPLERIASARAPCGFDFRLAAMPAWAKQQLGPDQRALVDGTASPKDYLRRRGAALTEALAAALPAALAPQASREQVDEAVSFAERLLGVAQPRGTTVGWLGVLLNYGHTVSGELVHGDEPNPILAALHAHTGLGARVIDGGDRDAANARWLIGYTNGIMDTDALANLVYGELYVPIAVVPGKDPITMSASWTFAADLIDALGKLACVFERPFWADYQVTGNTRTRTLADGITLSETRTLAEPHHYRVTVTGMPYLTQHHEDFLITKVDHATCRLTWSTSFQAALPATPPPLAVDPIMAALQHVAQTRELMRAALAAHFAPR
jgi:hypothetical protein